MWLPQPPLIQSPPQPPSQPTCQHQQQPTLPAHLPQLTQMSSLLALLAQPMLSWSTENAPAISDMSILQESVNLQHQLLLFQSTLNQHNPRSQSFLKLQLSQSSTQHLLHLFLAHHHAVPIHTTMASESAFAQQVSTLTTEPAHLVLPAESTPTATLTVHAPAILASLTTVGSAPNVLKAHSGAPLQTSAFLSVAKTQPTLPQLDHANATPDSVFSADLAKLAPTITSFPMDTA